MNPKSDHQAKKSKLGEVTKSVTNLRDKDSFKSEENQQVTGLD